MSTKLKKRITRQVRIGAEIHKKAKLIAKKEKRTMSKLLDEILSGELRRLIKVYGIKKVVIDY